MTAIAAAFADFKLVKTRKIAQLVLEVPIEQADAALAALGGLPRSDAERWVGIAPIDATAVAARPADGGAPHASVKGGDKPRLRFHEMPRSQQAAIKCGDEAFQKWLGMATNDPMEAEVIIKKRLGIERKRELAMDPDTGMRWDALLAQFEAATGRMAERR